MWPPARSPCPCGRRVTRPVLGFALGNAQSKGRRGDAHPPLQSLHEHHGDQGQALLERHGTQADILLSGITTIDNPAARNLYLDVTSTNPMGVTNQEFINRAALNHQPGPDEHDPRSDVFTCAARAEDFKHLKYDDTCAATMSHPLLSFRARDYGRPRDLYRDGVLPLRQATAGLGPTGGRSRGQAQEGHLVCAPPGHDRPSA